MQDGWPSSSPDLNPIEIIWDYMKDSISLISKLYLLKNEAIPQGKINGLIGSILSRIVPCIKDKEATITTFNFYR